MDGRVGQWFLGNFWVIPAKCGAFEVMLSRPLIEMWGSSSGLRTFSDYFIARLGQEFWDRARC